MEASDILTSNNSQNIADNDTNNAPKEVESPYEELLELQRQVLQNYHKPNVPNINVPEKIIICLDVCFSDPNSLFRLGDGTTFTPINMMKRVLDFFLYSKHAINSKTEFALVTLNSSEPCWVQNFTNKIKEVINALDYISPEEPGSESFDFSKLFNLIKSKVEIPDSGTGDIIQPPPYVVRMIVLFGRSNSIPIIPHEDPYFISLKKELYFFIDILLAHEEDCAVSKCEEIYDALQDLDDGYSYVFEVSKNATKIHDCVAKLLAHPFQRPLQKNTDYAFGSRY